MFQQRRCVHHIPRCGQAQYDASRSCVDRYGTGAKRQQHTRRRVGIAAGVRQQRERAHPGTLCSIGRYTLELNYISQKRKQTQNHGVFILCVRCIRIVYAHRTASTFWRRRLRRWRWTRRSQMRPRTATTRAPSGNRVYSFFIKATKSHKHSHSHTHRNRIISLQI